MGGVPGAGCEGGSPGKNDCAVGCAAIVTVASTRAHMSEPDTLAYSASKGAVRLLSKSMALELGRDNIIVNAISPGPVKTQPVLDRMIADPEDARQRIERYMPAAPAALPPGQCAGRATRDGSGEWPTNEASAERLRSEEGSSSKVVAVRCQSALTRLG